MFEPSLARCLLAASVVAAGLAATEELATRILSLPIYPTLTAGQVRQVAEAVAAAVAEAVPDALAAGTP